MGNLVSKLQFQSSCNTVTIDYPQGERYIGECLPGQIRNGQGTYYHANGDRYEGEWLNNNKHGNAYMYYANGELYMGQWEFNRKNGQGMHFYADGSRYDGNWWSNVKHGEATFYDTDKNVWHGTFKDNDKHGKFTVKMHNGDIYEEEWSYNERTSQKLVQGHDDEDRRKRDLANLEEKIPISQWREDHVCRWLQLKGFDKYIESFKSHHISGNNLFDLTDEDLAGELSITEDADREKMIAEIILLKQLHEKNLEGPKYLTNYLTKFYEEFRKMTLKKEELDQLNLHMQQTEEEEKVEHKDPTPIHKDPTPVHNKTFRRLPSLNPRISEYNTIMYNYQEADYDLSRTLSKTLGTFCVVDYSEITIKESVGKGAYGEVFKASWLENDIAVKFFNRNQFFNEKRIDTDFLKEVAVLSRLRHPNIVLFMGVSITPENKGALLTEYLEGGNLFDHLHTFKTYFDDEKIKKIALDMALGMNYLHGQKIFHCDLKSSNILLDENSNIHLADFGLSKLRKSNKIGKSQRVGTILWMAPEIMREEEYEEASDVYSYGMILWELMTRKVPYEGMKLYQIVGAVGYGDKQVEMPETGDHLLLALVQRCLMRNKEERPKFKKIVKFLRGSDKYRKIYAMKKLESVFSGGH